MNEHPEVPRYLPNLYDNLPRQIADVLEQSGVIGYVTVGVEGADTFHRLIMTCKRACGEDAIIAKIEPELFIRSMCAGWVRMKLDESATNSVASTADEYYKGLFTARQDVVSRRQITSTGMNGFQEQATPEDWDFALGSVKGFRKWQVEIDEGGALIGSYGKDFLSHKMLSDGRRIAECHGNGSTHPKEEVPAETACGCGWWLYWSPEEAAKHNGRGTGSTYVLNVTVGVEGSGRVVIGQKGSRSQYIRITGIAPDSDDSGADVLEELAKFSRKHLLDAPVYRGTDALREGVGVDSQYGTLGARYPELSGHSNEALAIYVVLLRRIGQDCKAFSASEEYRFDRTMDESACSYLQTTVELLSAESAVVAKILSERGEDVDTVVEKLRVEEATRKMFPA